MSSLIIKWLVNALAIFITAYVVPGIRLHDFGAAIWAAFALGIVNAIIKPILVLFTLPINVLTLGLFTLIINALMVLLVSRFVTGFGVANFGAALLGSIVISLISIALNSIVR